MDKKYDVLIIGGGTAGIMVAAQLINKKQDIKIGLIEPSDKHYYQPAWTLVGAGTYKYKDTIRDEKTLIPKGVDWIRDYAETFNTDQNSVATKKGDQYSYDFLVVAPGIQIDLDKIPGLKESLGKNGVCSNYTDPDYTWEVVKNFKGGNAIFGQPDTPIKCGGAPQKIMYLADDYFRKSGVRKKSEIIYQAPGSVIFGVEPYKQTMQEVVRRKEIKTKFFHSIASIDGAQKIVYLRNTHTQENATNQADQSTGETINEDGLLAVPFEMLHLAPPQSAPDFIKNSSLAYADGPNKGWLEVDIHTLQHKRFPNIFGLGDSAALPTAKTGAAVRKQAPVVVDNIIQLMDHKKLGNQEYNGYSSCPLVTGYGKMVLAEFKYDNVRDSDPLLSKIVDTSKESWLMWILKKYGLPYLYWNKMMKGKM